MLRRLLKRFYTGEKGEGIISEIIGTILVVGLLSLLMFWLVININGFQLQTALNSALKKAQVDGYLTQANISKTQSYLADAGLTSSVVTSPQMTSPVAFGQEIQITITASTMPLPALDSTGQPVADSSRSKILTASGYIVSQYSP